MTTSRQRAYDRTAGWLMGIGAGATILLWSVNAAEPMAHNWYAVLLTISIICLLVGLAFRVAFDAAAWAVMQISQTKLQPADTGRIDKLVAQLAVLEAGQLALRAGQGELRETQAVIKRSVLRFPLMEERLGQRVDAVKDGVAEGADQVEAVARVTAANAVEELSKKFETRFDALEARADKIAADSYADGLVDGASGIKAVRQLHPRPEGPAS